jgi:hypothetical protein
MAALTESISSEAGSSSAGAADYWSHMDRVSTFKKAEHHHKLTPAEQVRTRIRRAARRASGPAHGQGPPRRVRVGAS